MTNCVWSPRLRCNIGYALIDIACQPGDMVTVLRQRGPVTARLTGLPFL
jgi:hypothetical protein